MILRVKSSVVQNKKIRPIRNTMSAIFSYFKPSVLLLRIDKNDNKLLVMKKMIATAVSSSIIVASLNLRTLMDVRTIKHNPSKFEEVLSM